MAASEQQTLHPLATVAARQGCIDFHSRPFTL
jgi:hypothetical protein